VVGIDDLLGSLGLTPEERLALYREAASLSRHDGEDYRSRRTDLRDLLGRPDALAASSGGAALAKLLAARRRALESVAVSLAELERERRLGRTREELCRTHIHMYVNRLGAGDQEQLALQLLRRTREGLSRAPAADPA
jgi:thiopeptide-type bacteriocin biosynthesis protein